MKEFLKWFKSSTKIKRWILLMLIGITLVCYGIAKIIVTDELGFKALIKIVLSFIFGFTFTILSIVCIQKRTLELLVQESDTRDIEKGNGIDSLIFNKKIYNQGPKVVVIGGGTGLNTVLKGLKNYTDNITAIVTVSDYGEDKKIKNNSLKDIKDSFISLANNEEDMNKLLNLKLGDEKNSFEFSDVYFSAMEKIIGDFPHSIERAKNVLNITGTVLPVTLDTVNICAELEDGTVVESKEKIPEIVNEKISKISRVYLSPTNCRVAPGVLEAIRDADAIVIGPGSIYTNVIPNLLVAGVSKAIKESRAFKIYVSNIMTEFGQTDNFNLSDHIQAILDHTGKGIIDYCIYDTGEIVPEYVRKYNKEGCDLVEQDVANVKAMGIKLIQRNLSKIENDTVRHNPDAIATAIIQLICEDLKFNDMQNDAQFIMLDSRIKETERKLKKEEKAKNNNRKNKKDSKEKTSKFFEKYKERIESIKESEEIKTKGSMTKDKKVEEKKNTEESKSESKNKDSIKENNRKHNEHRQSNKSNKKRDIVEDQDLRNILDKMRK